MMKCQEDVFALLPALIEPRIECGASSRNLDLQARFSRALRKSF